MTTEKTQCEKDLQKYKRASAHFKKITKNVPKLEAESAVKDQAIKEATAKKETAEYNAYIYKMIADAATKGIRMNGQVVKVELEEAKLIKLDKGLTGKSDADKTEFMKAEISEFCKLNSEGNKGNVNPGVLKYRDALGQTISLKDFCKENANLLEGFKAPALVVVEEATEVSSMEPAVQDNLPGGSHPIEGGE